MHSLSKGQKAPAPLSHGLRHRRRKMDRARLFGNLRAEAAPTVRL
jgi:hypothetical protein